MDVVDVLKSRLRRTLKYAPHNKAYIYQIQQQLDKFEAATIKPDLVIVV